MKKIIVLFTILFVVFHAFAQEKINGYVEDSLTHNRLTNVSVTLLRNGKPLKFTCVCSSPVSRNLSCCVSVPSTS